MSIVVLVTLACASAQPELPPDRRVIVPNLHPMAVNEKGQNYTVNGYLAFQMECLGESKDYDYWFFAGVGGDAHAQVYTSDPMKWCNCLSHLDFTPELVKTWYDAVGYDFSIVTEEQFNADRPRYVGELTKCIDRGIPVIAKQNTKENGDFWLLIGYEEYEDKRIQLLFVTDNSPGAETRHIKVPTNGHVNYQFILPGAKKKAPPLADVYRKVVLNIPALLTQPKKGDIYYGRGAFNAWADYLQSEDYAGKTDDELVGWKHHGIFVCIVATNGSCRTFLERAQKLCPNLPFLAEVNKEYAEMGRLWWKDLNAAGGSFGMTAATFKNKETKRPIVDIIRRMGACCDRIVEIYRKNGYTSDVQKAYAVKTANGGSYLDGMPRLKWGVWKDNSYGGSLTLLLNAAGVPVSYDEVMGLSGVCYQAMMKTDWDPSSHMPQNGMLCEKNVGDALGIAVYTLNDEKAIREQARKSIDHGYPVLMVGGRGNPEWTLACGYAIENGNAKFFGRSYDDGDPLTAPKNAIYTENQYSYFDGFPGVYPGALTRFYDKPCTPISRKQALRVSLDTCIKMFEQKSSEGVKFGYDAYDVLISGFELDDAAYQKKCGCAEYHIGSMLDARRAAYVYLNASTNLLDGANKIELADVARLYQTMLNNLLAAAPYDTTTAVFSSGAKHVWTAAERQKLAAALRENKRLEQQARVIVADILGHWE